MQTAFEARATYREPASTAFEVGRRYGAKGYEIIVTARTSTRVDVVRIGPATREDDEVFLPRRLLALAPHGVEQVRAWTDPYVPTISALDRLPDRLVI
jgi:hypothetical protein